MRPEEKSHTSKSPFEAQTTHQTDFAPKPPQQPREPFIPKEEHKRPSSKVGRFDYLTIMKRDFPEHVGHKPDGNYKPKQIYKPTGKERQWLMFDRCHQRLSSAWKFCVVKSSCEWQNSNSLQIRCFFFFFFFFSSLKFHFNSSVLGVNIRA